MCAHLPDPTTIQRVHRLGKFPVLRSGPGPGSPYPLEPAPRNTGGAGVRDTRPPSDSLEPRRVGRPGLRSKKALNVKPALRCEPTSTGGGVRLHSRDEAREGNRTKDRANDSSTRRARPSSSPGGGGGNPRSRMRVHGVSLGARIRPGSSLGRAYRPETGRLETCEHRRRCKPFFFFFTSFVSRVWPADHGGCTRRLGRRVMPGGARRRVIGGARDSWLLR